MNILNILTSALRAHNLRKQESARKSAIEASKAAMVAHEKGNTTEYERQCEACTRYSVLYTDLEGE